MLAIDKTKSSMISDNHFDELKSEKFLQLRPHWRLSILTFLETTVPFILLISLTGPAIKLSALFCVPVILLMGIYFHKLSILLHDIAHMTFFPSRRTNIIVGNLIAWICLTDFKSFRKSHMSHHANAGRNEDKEIGDFIRDGNPKKMISFFLKNLFCLNLTQGNPERSSFLLSKSIIGLLATQSIIFSTVAFSSEGVLFGLLWVFSVVTVGVFFSRLRTFLEHFNVHGENEVVTRSHYCGGIEKFIFFGGYMNYHCEHHLFPSIPCYLLPRVSSKLQKFLKPEAKEISVLSTLSKCFKLKHD